MSGLSARTSKSLDKLWDELWHTPQSVAWEALGWTRIVARYARLVIAAEAPKAAGALLSEARQLEDRLGLTPMSMKRLQWEIGPHQITEDQEGEERAPSKVTQLDDYRDLVGG